MKHFHDLTPSRIRDSLNSGWRLSEKLDGSYMRGGFDADGRFYTLRKSNAVYYHLSDWPMKPWTNAFRAGHVVLEMLLTTARDMGYIQGEFWIDVELIHGTMPNSITYKNYDNNVIITASSDISRITIFESVLSKSHGLFTGAYTRYEYMNIITIVTDQILSDTGESLRVERRKQEWKIYKNPSKIVPPQRFDSVRELETFLSTPLLICGRWIPSEIILELKLNVKPAFISDDDWKANRKTLIEEIRKRREAVREMFHARCQKVRREVEQTFSVMERSSDNKMEGVVVEVEHSGDIFKLVSLEYFGKLNNFTHIVRYWLQGGRRPERPSFLTRTRHWPVEKRLERLEVLRRRYVKNKSKLKFLGTPYYLVNELDQRTLCTFAELKERITHGRDGI